MNGAPTIAKKEITGVTGNRKYVVREPFRIVVEGAVHTGGDSLSLPDDEKTRFWRRARWIEPAPIEEKVAAQ